MNHICCPKLDNRCHQNGPRGSGLGLQLRPGVQLTTCLFQGSYLGWAVSASHPADGDSQSLKDPQGESKT